MGTPATGPVDGTLPMTLSEAIAAQPRWLTYWVNWMAFATIALPLALLIWRPSRLAGVATVVVSIAAGFGVNAMYAQMGYVRLLGLPHIILYTPLVIWLFAQARRPDMPAWPRRILWVVIATIAISLAFDYTDSLRYLLGETAAQ